MIIATKVLEKCSLAEQSFLFCVMNPIVFGNSER